MMFRTLVRLGGEVGLNVAPYPRRPPSPLFAPESRRSHSEAWAGCIVSLTISTKSTPSLSKSVSSLSLAENASSVFLASYFLR